MTNADRIRAMTNEEIAALFTMEYNGEKVYICPAYAFDCREEDCEKCLLNWLKREE